MPDEQEPMDDKEMVELPAITIIKQIREKMVDPKQLPVDIRQACVECLLAQFMSVSKIAEFLQKDDRTIQRDKKEIERRNSEKPSTDYSLRVISELTRKANTIQEQLMSMTREADASVQEKAQAGFYLWKSVQEQIKLMQSLGYMPTEAMKIEANITQESGKDVTQLKAELDEVEKIIIESGRDNDPAIAGLIKSIKQEIAIAQANNNMDELKKLISPPSNEGKPDDSNGQ